MPKPLEREEIDCNNKLWVLRDEQKLHEGPSGLVRIIPATADIGPGVELQKYGRVAPGAIVKGEVHQCGSFDGGTDVRGPEDHFQLPIGTQPLSDGYTLLESVVTRCLTPLKEYALAYGCEKHTLAEWNHNGLHTELAHFWCNCADCDGDGGGPLSDECSFEENKEGSLAAHREVVLMLKLETSDPGYLHAEACDESGDCRCAAT